MRENAIRSILPASVRIAIADDDDAGLVRAEELDLISRAVPARRREFLLGRRCARAALAEVGVLPAPILMHPSGAPVWPPGFVGSITHCHGFVGAVASRDDELEALGFDAEPAVPLDDELIPSICTEAEIAWLGATASPGSMGWPKLLFCAKEAVHKCIAPRWGITLDWTGVIITVNARISAFSVCSNRTDRRVPDFDRIEGGYAMTDALVFATAFVRATRPES